MSKSHSITAANIVRENGTSPLLLICEHASNAMPDEYGQLGLSPELLNEHIAYDPGAFELSMLLSAQLDATLIYSGVSRLIYDCNRPPDAVDSMPERSEIYDIPGNTKLTSQQKQERVQSFYEPFRRLIEKTIDSRTVPTAIVTIHSFTPVYNGQQREVEFGVLHDSDACLADQLLHTAPTVTGLNVQRNEPYGPASGVTHTLKLHGINNDLLNVMLEVRNDKLATNQQQVKLANDLARLLPAAYAACSKPCEKNGAYS